MRNLHSKRAKKKPSRSNRRAQKDGLDYTPIIRESQLTNPNLPSLIFIKSLTIIEYGKRSERFEDPGQLSHLEGTENKISRLNERDTHLSTLGITATSASSALSLKSNSTNLTTYAATVTPTVTFATETIAIAAYTVENTTATMGGTVTTGDIITLTVRSKSLTGLSETVQYKVPSGATTITIATPRTGWYRSILMMLLTIVDRQTRLSSDARIEEEEKSLTDQYGHQASRINCSPLPILS